MSYSQKGKKILTIFVMLLALLCMINGKPLELLDDFREILQVRYINNNHTVGTQNIKGMNQEFSENIWHGKELYELNGLLGKLLHIKGFYGKEGIYIAEGNYIVSAYKKTDTDYELEQVTQLQQYLQESGIDLFYVNAPIKYSEDSFMEKEFGIDSYGNRNADLLLQRLEEQGISCIDLRKLWIAEHDDVRDMFYRTDHHWTTEAGLWAARTIAENLNEKAGYEIDLMRLASDNYTYKHFANCWLGEQGQKVTLSYVGLDDFVLIKPDYPTNLKVDYYWGTKEGDFSILLDESKYSQTEDPYDMGSWHYSYMPGGVNRSVIHNLDVEEGKILLLGDSYSQVVSPFLAMGVEEVSTLVLRGYDGDLLQLIEDNHYDTVIILYASFMIGAHDDPASSNYEMFSFVR